MDTKTNEKRGLLIVLLYVFALFGAILQAYKNCDCAFSLIIGQPIGLSTVVFFIIGSNLTIVIHKILFYNSKRILPLEYLEWMLAILAILCSWGLDKNGNLLFSQVYPFTQIISSVYLTIGVVGSIILSNILLTLIREENSNNPALAKKSKTPKNQTRQAAKTAKAEKANRIS